MIGKIVEKAANGIRLRRLRAAGWEIGPGVTVSRGARLEAKKGFIGADTYIGPNCSVQGESVYIGENCILFSNVDILVRGSLRLGARCKLSRNVTFRGHNITVGDELWCNENAEVGGGGWMKDTADLTVGDHVHMGKNCSINVCAPVTIGSCTGVGIDCMIFTHSSGNGQSILEGYSHVEMPVTVGSHVSLFTRVMIAPGAVVGDGVTVGAMSYVTGHARPGCFYAGIPAREKRQVSSPPAGERLELLRQALEEELSAPVSTEAASARGGVLLTECLDGAAASAAAECGCAAVVCLGGETELPGAAVFRLGENTVSGPSTPVSEAVRDALRRNGILVDYRNYVPAKLSPRVLCSRGVEKG